MWVAATGVHEAPGLAGDPALSCARSSPVIVPLPGLEPSIGSSRSRVALARKLRLYAPTVVNFTSVAGAPGIESQVRADAGRVMARLWRPEGYTAPGATRYPWQWLWDSCFHALIWGALGDARATRELETLFGLQRDDGMLPHMGYQREPQAAVSLWGAPGVSTITQPPMFGHSLAVLAAAGYDVEPLVDPARRALGFLLERRQRADGLVLIAHPWESGNDDSVRFDRFCPGGFDAERFREVKFALVRRLALSSARSALGNPFFAVASASFNALLSFNCSELAGLCGDDALRDAGTALAEGLDAHFDADAETWTDLGADGAVCSNARALESLLGVLVTRVPGRAEAVLTNVVDGAFAGPFGTRGVHPDEAAYERRRYWRGAGWPPLDYLLWLAAQRRSLHEVAERLRVRALVVARASGYSEYYDPETGEGLGSIPQAWACLPVAMSRS